MDCGTNIQTAIDALNLYHTQYDQVDKLWSYFGTVTLAVLGFSIGVEKATKSFLEATIIVVGYAVFCYGNYQALALGQEQLLQFASFAKDQAGQAEIPLNHLQSPFVIGQISMYYWGVVGAACLGILGITYSRSHS